MTDVLISGAGVAGPTLAMLLNDAGFRVTIVERAPEFRDSGYVIDFWGVGYDVAERMDLLPALRVDAYRIDQVEIVNSAGKRIGGFDVSVMDRVAHGRYLSIPRGDLARDIYNLLPCEVERHFGTSITALNEHDNGVHVEFDHLPARDFDIVVGADGLHSNVRSLAFGPIEQFEKYLGYYTAAFTSFGYPHRDEGKYVGYSIPGGQLARHAMRDGKSTFFMIIARDEKVDIPHHDVAAQKQLLHEAFDNAGWESKEILRAMDDAGDFYFDEVAQVHMSKWSNGRIVLLGDAAYCPSLLAGQGSGFAMAGAYLLAHALAKADSYQSAFAEYERRFKPFLTEKQKAAEGFARFFAPRTRLGLTLRNLMTNAMNLPVLGPYLLGRSLADHFELPLP